MKSVLFEIGILLLLLVANGMFAMTEIAVISARRSRLRQQAERGDGRARVALDLAESPNRFLATVQIGITLVGILAGAYGGATLAEQSADRLRAFPSLMAYADAIGLAVVVIPLAFLSLVLGELVPKRLGLGHPEHIATAMARPMQWLSIAASPIVRLLSAATELLLRFFNLRPGTEAAVTDDEVKGLMQEGLRAGAFNQVESRMVESVLELDGTPVRDLMTPRPKIIWLNRDESHEIIWHKIVVSGHSYFPVYEENRDHVVGIVSVKAIYANLAAGIPVCLRDVMTRPLVVPATQSASQLLETFKQSGIHIGLVTDEFGGIVGLVTLHDVMEAIVGDFLSPDERLKPAAKKRDDGSWLIDGMLEVERLEELLHGFTIGDKPNKDYQTLAGFIVKHLGRVPREGETFETQGHVFEVLDMDRHRIDKVLVLPAGKAETTTSGTKPD